jgi:hypothetical protein
MPWRLTFTYLREHDAVLARFDDVELVTPADAARWAKEVEAKLEGYGRKVYLLIDLGGLVVKPTAAREFGRLRADVLAKYAHASFRFGGDRPTITTVYTSSVLHNAAANHHASFEDALAALKRERDGTASSR